MLATQSQPDWRLVVQCRGSNELYPIQYDVPMMDPLSEIQNRSVTLNLSYLFNNSFTLFFYISNNKLNNNTDVFYKCVG